MHPTFAAIVCKETVSIVKSTLSTFFKANIVKGMKIIKETSLVINIELKNTMKTKMRTKLYVFPILTNNLRTNISKIAKFFKISTTTMIVKSKMIVSQLIYFK